MLPGGDWHQPEVLDIAVAGDTIVGVAESFAPAVGTPIEELDAHGHLVLPGFVNAHYHSHDVLAKGTLEEVPLETWRLYALPPQYPPRSVEEVRARTLLGALECLRSGMTTIQDMTSAELRYGTCTILVPVLSWNSSAARCVEVPAPDEP